MLPLLFVCVSQHRPLRVRNPIRCNRRILSQPCFHRSYSPRYPFGAPLRSHLLYLSVPFLSALRNVLCKTSMINTLFLIAFAYSYSSTGNPDCQCSFVSLLLITAPLFPPVSKQNMPEVCPQFLRVRRSPLRYKVLQAVPDPLLRCYQR